MKKKLTKQQIEEGKENALDREIQRWLRIVNGEPLITKNEIYADNPCCQFSEANANIGRCWCCAINDFTGKDDCVGTQFRQWYKRTYSTGIYKEDPESAAKMLQFLIKVKVNLRKKRLALKTKTTKSK